MSMQKIYGFVILSSLLIPHLAFAAPEGGVVTAGSAVINQYGANTFGNKTIITQTSPAAVINWHSFDTNRYETVAFNQPNANSVILNRINSGVPTNFAGSLFANGKVFIVNSAGMVFTEGSRINTTGFLATTMDINDNDFMSGKYKFFSQPGSENSSITNNGSIFGNGYNGFPTVSAGFVALIAPNVINGPSGLIAAGTGSIVLASGAEFVLDFNQDGLINFDASSIIKNGYIENAGNINARDGKVFMTTNTVSTVLDSMINTSGITEANAVVKNNNEIILGTITTGQIIANKISLKADNGITINGDITTNLFGHGPAWRITAKTMAGNISINSYMAGNDISLSAEKGAIIESNASTIWAINLHTYSTLGTTLSGKNNIERFTAINTTRGGIYLKNYGGPVTDLGETGGGYKLEPIGFWEYYFGGND